MKSTDDFLIPIIMVQLKSFLQDYGIAILSISLLGMLVLSNFIFPEYQQFMDKTWEVIWSNDKERITAWFKSFGVWGPLMIIVLMLLQMFMIIFPTWLPMIIAVIGYGPVWGVVISVAAVAVASTVGYWLGERLGKHAKGKLVSESNYDKLERFMKRYGFGAVVLFRISPFLSNDAISFIAGIMKMGYWRYMAATLAGILPLSITIAYFGSDTERLKAGLYWIGGGGVLLYLLYVLLDRRRRKAKDED